MNIIIAGIHTGIGKTICSAIICQALGYDYWKPVQAGDLANSDSLFIKKNVTNEDCFIHPERFRLSIPASPHYAAIQDGIEIRPSDFILPKTTKPLAIETAGGIMSPFSNNFLNIDLIQQFNLPVILVSNNYLGSINHTLLTVNALLQKNIAIKGLVFSGEAVESTRAFILQHTQLPVLFSIPLFEKIDSDTIANFAKTVSINL
ncbi:dethiobiotin synthase [Ferruginibacter paludis]|uniref:dethiobiotin synthase n=1 Tax=Ferruginibacter paludis TaxID=1310417 RepID=UPI0025B40364|nr:dethiobiotin synthase [Ferruginibacter paludis]MDN3654034.1 dethiobiotin synthase [Ferruginibacter paludis]